MTDLGPSNPDDPPARRPLRRFLVPAILATILSLGLFYGLAWIAATAINLTR